MVQGKSSVLTSRVMEVSPFSVCAESRATRSYFCALMEVRVNVSEKRFASPMVWMVGEAGLEEWGGCGSEEFANVGEEGERYGGLWKLVLAERIPKS